jgi:hypothetical protein
MALHQFKPPASLTGQDASHVLNQPRQRGYLQFRVPAQYFETLQVLCRNMRLMEETVEFIQALDAIVLFPRHPLAVLADMLTMPAPGKLFVGASSSADATKVAHRKQSDLTLGR